MTVLFGFSKRDNVTQDVAFAMAAITVAVLALFTLLIVRNPEIKMPKAESEVQNEEELSNMQQRQGNYQTPQNSINAPYE